MSAKKKSGNELPLISNSKARHKFTIGDKYEAGIQLRALRLSPFAQEVHKFRNLLPG